MAYSFLSWETFREAFCLSSWPASIIQMPSSLTMILKTSMPNSLWPKTKRLKFSFSTRAALPCFWQPWEIFFHFPKTLEEHTAHGKHSLQGGWLTPTYSWVKPWKPEGSNLAEDSEFYLEFGLSGSWAPGLPAVSVPSWLFPAHCNVL